MLKPIYKLLQYGLLIFSVGVIAGLGAVFFRDLIGLFHNLLFYGKFSTVYDVLQHSPASPFGPAIILAPVLGAIAVAFLVKNFAPEAKGHGVPEVMDAIHYGKGKIRPVVAVIKSIASSISIGSGGSIGREGPIIQIGAAFGSAIGQWVKVTDKQRMILIACGAGGGIAATFNTPLGGILFALEIMLTEYSAATIIPVSIATAIATYTSYYFFGNAPFMPDKVGFVADLTIYNLIAYVFLSLIIGVVSAIFIKCIYWTEDLFDKIPGGYYVRHALGMLLVGITIYLMLVYSGHYYVQGVGYATVEDVLRGLLSHPWFLLLLVILKILLTSLTLGSGGSGGIFSPLLFIGATLGACVAIFIIWLCPEVPSITVPLAALGGMAGMVGACTAAPITAIIMTAEMINNFYVMLPLMIIVAISYAVRRALLTDSVYTLKLSRRGHFIPEALVARKKASR